MHDYAWQHMCVIRSAWILQPVLLFFVNQMFDHFSLAQLAAGVASWVEQALNRKIGYLAFFVVGDELRSLHLEWWEKTTRRIQQGNRLHEHSARVVHQCMVVQLTAWIANTVEMVHQAREVQIMSVAFEPSEP